MSLIYKELLETIRKISKQSTKMLTKDMNFELTEEEKQMVLSHKRRFSTS